MPVDWLVLGYGERQRERFRSGELIQEWYKRYPVLFDVNDVENALHQRQNHFFEWFAAIILYESAGLLSLVEQYQFKKHAKKQEVLAKLGIIDMVG